VAAVFVFYGCVQINDDDDDDDDDDDHDETLLR